MSATKQHHHLEDLVDDLSQYEGRGTQLVSVYIPPEKPLTDVLSHITDEYSQAQNIKQKSTRTNVQDALSSIKSRLKHYEDVPENGLALFSGAIDTGGGQSDLETIVVDNLPTPIESFRYHCDNEFLVTPLEKKLETGDEYALIILDRRTAQIGRLQGTHVEVLHTLNSLVPGKHTKGGQSQQRFERLRLEAIENFYQEVAERINREFVDDRHSLEGILVGGPSPTKEEFVENGGIHHELRDKILGTFDIDDTTERGLHQFVEAASDVIEENKRVQQRESVQRFLKNLKSDGDATYGFEETCHALDLGAVETLLVSTEMRGEVTVFECDDGHQVRRYGCNETLETCPKCATPGTRHQQDIHTHLNELAKSRGTDVVFIDSDFEEGAQLKEVFGGFAGILRFQVSSSN